MPFKTKVFLQGQMEKKKHENDNHNNYITMSTDYASKVVLSVMVVIILYGHPNTVSLFSSRAVMGSVPCDNFLGMRLILE